MTTPAKAGPVDDRDGFRGTLTLVKIGGKSLIPEEALLSRQAIVAPKFADFVPVEVTGKPASEMIIDEREAR